MGCDPVGGKSATVTARITGKYLKLRQVCTVGKQSVKLTTFDKFNSGQEIIRKSYAKHFAACANAY